MESQDVASYAAGTDHLAQGWTEPFYPSDPLAGEQLVRTIPIETYEVPQALSFTFTASAVVATRNGRVEYRDADNKLVAAVPATGGVVASTSVVASLTNGLGAINLTATGFSYSSLPDIVLRPRWSVKVFFSNMDAGDQISAAVFMMKRVPADVASGKWYYEALDAWRAMFKR